MIEHLKAFLRFLALNRNVSPHTVRAYDSDLSQFLGHVAADSRRQAPRSRRRTPSTVTAIRAFLADLHARGPVAVDGGAQARRASARSSATCAAKA